MSPNPAQRWTLLATALVPLLLLTWRFDFICDDAYITFVYARNLAEGRGLVYNPGEWVEGYSEFLWALALAGGQVVGLSPLILSRLLSVLAGVLVAFVVTGWLARRHGDTPVAAHGAALFLGCAPPLAVWSTGGLATMPFLAASVLLFSLLWVGDRPSAGWKLGLVAGFAALLRADGAWWVAFTLGPAIALGLLRRDAKLWRPALVGTAISAGLFLAHLGWRYATYDDWLPHTARVKVGVSAHAAERGSSYLVHFLITFPGVVLALALGAVAARRPRVGAAYLIVLATAVYVVLVGGDFMAFGRFLVPLLPFAALVLAGGLAVLEGRFGRVAPAAAGLLSTALVLTPAFGVHLVPKALRTSCSVRHNRGDESRSRSELEQWQRMNLQAEEWLTLGEGLRMVSEPGDSLVYGAVGAIGWTSRLYLYDRNGLITPSVAKLPPQTEPPRSPGHDKTVSPEFFAQARPTYLFAAWIPAGAGRWQADVERTQNAQLIGYLRAGQLARKDLPQGEHPNPGHHLIVVPGR